MRSFFEDIKDSTLTWTTDDDISLSSFDSDESSLGDSSSNASNNDVNFGNDDEGDEVVVRRDHNDNVVAVAPLPLHQRLLDVDEHERVAGDENDNADSNANVEHVEGPPEHRQAELPIINDEDQPRNENENPNIEEGVQVQGEDQDVQAQAQAPAPREVHHNPNGNILNRRNSMEILQNIEAHERASSLLFRIARCEALTRPLIRAEIDWNLLRADLSTYPSAQLGDEYGVFLLANILRMDPPCEIVKETLKLYPKSCIDMDLFYAACQYSSDDVVQLLIKRTMKARKNEGIYWSMLALLGDARIRLRHAKMLLQYTPLAVVDPSHGPFGVSPLDRMMSGAFIHGDTEEWVTKLKLALRTAETGKVDDMDVGGNKFFYPFHALLRRLTSSDFMGVEFGALAFANCLSACVDGEQDHRPFHQLNNDGFLPLHSLFAQECNTNLGTIGERKLVKFLLNTNKLSATTRYPDGRGVIRLAVENGWPVYDIIASHCPKEYTEGRVVGDAGADSLTGADNVHLPQGHDLLIHDILNGPYNSRFGVYGARQLIKYTLKNYPTSASKPDMQGQFPIHLAIQNNWPCHDLIVSAAPHALEIPNSTNCLYPFQMAALSCNGVNRNGRISQLGMLYELIREGPLLLDVREAVQVDVRQGNKLRSGSSLNGEPALKRKRD